MTAGAPAPFRQLPGDPLAPAEGIAFAAADGVALRAALWRPGAPPAAVRPAGFASQPVSAAAPDPIPRRGTVLLFPGRTEYVEKYAPVAAALTAAGWSVLAIDWRGQGLSQRLLDDPMPGHIDDFAHYQRDVDALQALAEARALPRPWVLLAHSMGGAIGLRALLRGLPVAAAAFSAPMWGIRVGGLPDGFGAAVGSGLAAAAGRVGRGERPTPGASSVLDIAFAGNQLTTDVPEYTRFMREIAAWPDVALGPASWDWLAAAMAECRALAREAAPAVPALITLGSDETIVAPAAIRARAETWPGATLLELAGARHEALFEAPAIRAEVLRAILGHFAAAG